MLWKKKKKRKEAKKYSHTPKIATCLLSLSENLCAAGGWLRKAPKSQPVKDLKLMMRRCRDSLCS